MRVKTPISGPRRPDARHRRVRPGARPPEAGSRPTGPCTFALVGFLAVLGGFCAPAEGAEEAGPETPVLQGRGNARIVRIEITGSVSLTEGSLLRELSTRIGDPYDPATLDNDLRRLWKSGRYRVAPRWEIERVQEGGAAGVVLKLFLEERPVLRKIEFVGNKKIDTETLKAEVEKVGLFEGRRARYDEGVAHDAVVALKKLYREKAYFLAEISCTPQAYEGTDERGLASVKLVFDIEENRPAPLKGFRIVGNRAFTDDDLEYVIYYALRALGKGGWSRGYDRLLFARALAEVRRVYRDNGYLDAEVRLISLELFTRELAKGKRKQWLVAHIEVAEGPLYTVGKISLKLEAPPEGPPLEVTREELLGILEEPSGEFRKAHKPVKAGSVCSDTVKRQAVKRLETALGRYGRVGTKVRARDVFGEKGTKIDLDFVVRPSRPYRVRQARVRGNHKTKAIVFTREIYYAGIRPEERDPETGEVKEEASLLDSRKLDLAEKNIYYTGLVKSEYDEKTGRPRHGVKIRPVPLEDGLTDLIIDVNETETGQLMMGFSVSSNGELAGQIEFKQNNFDLFGLPRSWTDWTNAFIGAGQSFSLTAYFGQIYNVYRMNFVEPYFLGLPLRLQLGLSNTKSRRESYDETRVGWDGSLGHTWSLHRYKRRKLRVSARWKDEAVGIDNVDAGAPQIVKDEEGTSRIIRAGLGVTFDSVDNLQRPTDGMRLDISRDAAGGYLGGDKSFTVARLDLRAHKRIGKGAGAYPQVVNFRFRTSYADPYFGDTSVPFYERFYAGGIGTIRGFGYRSVGPADPGSGDPQGGSFRVLGTLEYAFPLESSNSFRGIFFLDAGNVWNNPSGFHLNTLKKSYGFGIEIMPQGLPFPISMYWSWIIDEISEDEPQRFSFMFGNMFFF